MAIVVRRDTGGFAVVRRLRVRLDGVTVGRIRHRRSLEVTGSGRSQLLSVSIDWVRSNDLTVVDPGPGSVLFVELSHRGVADSMLRTWLAPESVLVLVPAGQPVPPPSPVRLTWRRIARSWLTITAGTAVWATFMGLTDSHTVDPAAVASIVVGVSLAFALVVGVVAVLLHRD